MERILGIDYGDARTGIAVSDLLGFTAQGIETIHYKGDMEMLLNRIGELIKQYDVNLPIGFVGSVAFYFSDVLNEAAERCGIRIAKIMKDPMTGLIEYHNN